MRIIVLGGAGIIGQAIARDLVEDVDEVILGDLDQEAAREAAGRIGGNAGSMGVDVRDPDSLDQALRGADACINSVQYYFNLDVMAGCLRSQVPYLDLGGLFHTTRKQLELDSAFREAGTTAVLGLGSCPGVANVQAGYLGGMLDRVEYVRIYNGATLDEGDSLAWAYSIETILDEISQPAMVFRGGTFEEKPPLGEEEYYHFPEPIGYAKTHLSLHSEVATIPLSLADKGIQECFFKITFFGYSEAALRKLKFLSDLGFARREPMPVRGLQVAPRDVLIELLKQAPSAHQPHQSLGFKDVVTEVRGSKAGAEKILRLDTTAWPHQAWEMSGGKLMVASPPAVVGRWLADRSLDSPGVWAPENVIDGDAFFEALSSRGIETRMTETSVLAG